MTRKQPGDRAPAPGQLALVQAFINSHYDLEVAHGTELLATPEALAAWLTRSGSTPAPLPADESDLERALNLREGLRTLAREGRCSLALAARLNHAAFGASVEVRFTAVDGGAGGAYFVPAGGAGVTGAIGVLLAVTAQAMAAGSWSRLKICPGDHCGWAFYDHSRNRSGRWCAMSACGGRAKSRSHYQRRRSREP